MAAAWRMKACPFSYDVMQRKISPRASPLSWAVDESASSSVIGQATSKTRRLLLDSSTIRVERWRAEGTHAAPIVLSASQFMLSAIEIATLHDRWTGEWHAELPEGVDEAGNEFLQTVFASHLANFNIWH